MELSGAIEPYFSPLAAFLDANEALLVWNITPTGSQSDGPNNSKDLWATSGLNPSKRLDQLGIIQKRLWRVDCCAAFGRQLLVTPVFLPPDAHLQRIDVLLPCQTKQTQYLRQVLGSSALYGRSSLPAKTHGITEYVEEVLSRWALRMPYFKEIYGALPFGSLIIIENISTNLDDVKIRFMPNKRFLDELLDWGSVLESWTDFQIDLPPAIDRDMIVHKAHLNNTTNTRAYEALYHELRLLLSIPPHPNIIRRPYYIVKSADSNDRSKVIGFMLPFYPSGTLGDALVKRPKVSSEIRLRWATQIVATIQHIFNGPAGFYSDLKPDNILLSDDKIDLIFIDFEQGGNWDTFLAPEIMYERWMHTLSRNDQVPTAVRTAYDGILRTVAGSQHHETGKSPDIGSRAFRDTWIMLSRQQREMAMVFSVGKLLWCIFEATSHTRNSSDEEYTTPTTIEFPNFESTPEALRPLIRQCTAGAPEWRWTEDPKIVRTETHFVAFSQEEQRMISTPAGTVHASKRLWNARLVQMQSYMDAKCRHVQSAATDADMALLGFHSRPTLSEVARILNDEI